MLISSDYNPDNQPGINREKYLEAIKSAHRENQEIRKSFLKEFIRQKSTKKLGFHLLKNSDFTRIKEVGNEKNP